MTGMIYPRSLKICINPFLGDLQQKSNKQQSRSRTTTFSSILYNLSRSLPRTIQLIAFKFVRLSLNVNKSEKRISSFKVRETQNLRVTILIIVLFYNPDKLLSHQIRDNQPRFRADMYLLHTTVTSHIVNKRKNHRRSNQSQYISQSVIKDIWYRATRCQHLTIAPQHKTSMQQYILQTGDGVPCTAIMDYKYQYCS